MIEKGKNYTYEELADIFKKAQLKTVKKMSNDFIQANKQHNEEVDPMAFAFFTTQNQIAFGEFYRQLFKKEEVK